MGCKAGYPTSPCPYQFTGQVTRETCGRCVNFIPPKHILKWCAQWDRDKELCFLPKSACETCPFKVVRAPGRPKGEGKYDFKDPASRLEYEKEWRRLNADRVKAIAERFKKRHPGYFEKYRADHKPKPGEK